MLSSLRSKNKVLFQLVVICVFIMESQEKPSLSFKLPSIGPFTGFGPNNRDSNFSVKIYTGKILKKDSIRMVYFHDQTVAFVELGPQKLLLNCEIIEIVTMGDLHKSLGELRESVKPHHVTFKEMITLMKQCNDVENNIIQNGEFQKNSTQSMVKMKNLQNNPFSIFSGIIPGTKWCGTGDIARDYYDLGTESNVDKCCRTHDLCPVKIRAYSRRYNLTNGSLYTKSHCVCDDVLHNCLMHQKSQTAQIMGRAYFNLLRVQCLEESDKGKRLREAKPF